MTTLVKTHLMRKYRVEMIDLQYIGKKFDQFEDLSGNSTVRVHPSPIASSMFPQDPSRIASSMPPRGTGIPQVFLDMQDTTAGRSDDVVEF